MLPELNITFSLPLNHILNDDFNYKNFLENYNEVIENYEKNFQKFKKTTEPFQKMFKKYKKRILYHIEKYSGYSWKGQKIPIYLVNMTQKPSISHPLILKFTTDIDSMFILLIHELTHINLPGEMQSKAGVKVSEQWVNLITRHVALDLKLDIKKASMRNFSEALELNYDLKKEPLKKVLRSRIKIIE